MHLRFSSVLLLLACHHKPVVSAPPAAAAPTACPTPTTDPPMCTDPLLGASRERPLEWGRAGAGSTVWWGRLACADGSEPHGVTRGSIGLAPVPSTSPASENGLMLDVLDRWSIPCRTGEVTLYTNLYRCGEVCVPPTLRVLPHALDVTFQAGLDAAKAGDVAGALARGEELIVLGPEYEWSWAMRAVLPFHAGDPAAALRAMDDVIARWPTPRRRLNRVHVLVGLGRGGEARAALATFAATNTDASLATEILCTQAEIAPDPATSATLAAESCAAGFEACCPPNEVYRELGP
ncbi:MAG: hypothetical protein V4850_02875 [Myxococcota bacterium]